MAYNFYNVHVRKLFAQASLNGEAMDLAALDAQHADTVEALAALNAAVRALIRPSGTPRYEMVSSTQFTATASQTAFTVAAYDNVNDVVAVWVNGVRLSNAVITKTSTTVVTLAAQTTGNIVIIDISSLGNGTGTLASQSNAQGASLIGIEDINGLTTAATVEAAIYDILTKIVGTGGKSYLEGLLVLSGYLLKAGGTMSGAIAMGTNKITGLGAGTVATDAVNYGQISAYLSVWSNISGSYLALSGAGTMAGPILMGGNSITGLATATSSNNDHAASVQAVKNIVTQYAVPTGAILPYAGNSAPQGYLMCDGAAVSRVTYSTLNAQLAALSYPFGPGDGVNTMNLPDLRGRTIKGAGTATGGGTTGLHGTTPVGGTTLTGGNVGNWGGSESVMMTAAMIAPHYHRVRYFANSCSGSNVARSFVDNTGLKDTKVNTTTTDETGTVQTGIPSLAPFVALNYIIKV